MSLKENKFPFSYLLGLNQTLTDTNNWEGEGSSYVNTMPSSLSLIPLKKNMNKYNNKKCPNLNIYIMKVKSKKTILYQHKICYV